MKIKPIIRKKYKTVDFASLKIGDTYMYNDDRKGL